MPAGPLDLPDGFNFVRVLGHGAASIVVLARQVALDRLVAVKVVRVTHSASSVVDRVGREARVLAAMRHPHILQVFQVLPGASSVSLVTRYERRGDLAHAVAGLSGSELVTVLRDVASALDVAHEHGIVHRDLKPANVLLSESGRAVLGDFGLARLSRDPAAFRTVGSTVTGTPLYLAPEQILWPDWEVPVIDHYAYGVLAYELLTGRWPYEPPTWGTVRDAHLRSSPVPADQVVPGLPPAVASAMSGLLEKDVRRRWRPAHLMAALDQTAPDDWDELLRSRSGSLMRSDAATAPGTTTKTAGQTASAHVERRHPLGEQEPGPTDRPPPASTDRGELPQWVVPPVYKPPARRRISFRLAIAMVGAVLGALGYLAWLRL